jgi:hypothetical protein
MVFDLVCSRCGTRDIRRWSKGDVVQATPCRRCRQGMSVIGIAFFAPNTIPQRIAA